MSQDHHTNKDSPPESKSEREILELRVDLKLTEAKEALRDFNKVELQKIASSIYEPKLKRLRNWSGIIITVLVVGNIAGWYSVTERVHLEASRVIDQKLVDPQLTNTLNEALSKKAIPFITAQVRPIETNIAALKANLTSEQIARSNTLAQFDSSLQTFKKESTNALADVRSATEFSLIASKAQNDDYAAFSQLGQIAFSGNSPFAQSARVMGETIIQNVSVDTEIRNATMGFNWELYGIACEEEIAVCSLGCHY